MRLVLAFLFASLFIPAAPVTVQASIVTDGLRFMVQTDAPRSFYAQLDASGGATVQGPMIFQFELAAGQTFGATVPIGRGFTDGSIRVRVWASDGGVGPAAETIVDVTALPAQRVYLPLLSH
jgi:hypothetical protein